MLAEDQWHRFIFKINEYGNGYYLQIETEEGTWTVAHFYFDDSQLIYASVGTEFHFDGPNILNDYPAGFSFHHPVYHVYSSGGWTDWAASSGSNVNYFQHWYGNCTNPFRGHMPYQSDWRYWYAGTGASTGSNDRCFANPQF